MQISYFLFWLHILHFQKRQETEVKHFAGLSLDKTTQSQDLLCLQGLLVCFLYS